MKKILRIDGEESGIENILAGIAEGIRIFGLHAMFVARQAYIAHFHYVVVDVKV